LDLYRQHSSPGFIRACGYQGIAFKISRRKVRNLQYRELLEAIAGKPRPELAPLDRTKKFDLGGRKVS